MGAHRWLHLRAKEAGAIAVYEDVAELLAHLDESPVGKHLSG
ncbi:MAG TPA: hypothetical protein VK988_21485 [Acidimicrobiales bacterium]|nr:hypothetical protein [Acidimicrobiales bacterium]